MFIIINIISDFFSSLYHSAVTAYITTISTDSMFLNEWKVTFCLPSHYSCIIHGVFYHSYLRLNSPKDVEGRHEVISQKYLGPLVSETLEIYLRNSKLFRFISWCLHPEMFVLYCLIVYTRTTKTFCFTFFFLRFHYLYLTLNESKKMYN